MKFCDNKLCVLHIETDLKEMTTHFSNSEIVNQTRNNHQEKYRYQIGDAEVKEIKLCSTCSEVVEMIEIARYCKPL